MRHHHLFVLPLLTLFLAWTSLPSASAQDIPNYWYSGRTKTTIYLSETEMAVFPTSPKSFAKALKDREVFVDAGVDKTGDFATYLRVAPGAAAPRSQRYEKNTNHPAVRKVAPVYYPSKVAGPLSRLVPTGYLSVRYKEQSEAEIVVIEKVLGLQRVREFAFGAKTYLYAAESPFEAIRLANTIYETFDVHFAAPDWLREHQRKAVPNDTFYSAQWHLTNTGQTGGPAGVDIGNGRMEELWDTFKGSGQEVIAIVDDGLEIAHQDLAPNVRTDLGYDFVGNDSNPSPGSGDPHGTSVAGCAAGRGFNGQGVTGVAPFAALAGMRLIGAETDANSAVAETLNNHVIDIYTNSWGPFDDGDRLAGPGPLLETALEAGIANGRDGLGTVFIWASGNGLQFDDNVNYDGFANSPYVLAVAATNHLGQQAFYSEPGAPIAINVPSSGDGAGIVTSDQTGSLGYNDAGAPDLSDTAYTKTFGGTSAAAPVAAGVAALVLEANPSLTWREVQAVLKHTATQNDPTDPDWTFNGAGYHINHKYGFGRINAPAAVEVARTWVSIGQPALAESTAAPGQIIPDNDDTGISSSISIAENFTVEYVEILFSAPDHPYWGDLQVELVSPDGTVSVLAEPHFVSPGSAVYDNWRFGSARHFGESASGEWTLRVSDRFSQDTGTFQSWTLVLHGWQGFSGPMPPLYYPHVTVAGGWTTEIGIVNTSAEQALNATLESYDASGNPVGTPLSIDLAPNGRRQIDVAGDLDVPSSIAYCILNGATPSARGYLKYAIPGTYRAAVPASITSEGTTLNIPHIVSDAFWWTGLAFLNTAQVPRELTIAFDNGSLKTVSLGAGEKMALLIRHLFNGQPQPTISSGLITGAQDVVGVQLFGGGQLLAGVALTGETGDDAVYPHIIGGNDWWTGLVAHNPGDAALNATLLPYAGDGALLEPAQMTINPQNRTAGFSDDLGLDLETTWVQIQAGAPVSGIELFGNTAGTIMAGLNVTGAGSTSGNLPKIDTLGWTRIGLVNLSPSIATVTLEAFDDNGSLLCRTTLQIAGHAKLFQTAVSLFAPQELSDATHLSFSSDQPIAAFQLNGDHNTTMLDALPSL